MSVIIETKPYGQQFNRILDAVVTIFKYKKITIDHTIYIKVLSDVKMSYFTVSNDNVLNTNNNEISFTEITIVLESTLI